MDRATATDPRATLIVARTFFVPRFMNVQRSVRPLFLHTRLLRGSWNSVRSSTRNETVRDRQLSEKHAQFLFVML